MSGYSGRDNGTLRVTIRAAANRLGVTEAAVRKRIQRGSLPKEHGEDGRVYVYLDASRDASHPESQVHREARVQDDELVEELRDHIRYLRGQLDEERESRRRADTIIAQLTQANAALARRVPELEGPREPRDAPEMAAETSEGSEPRPATGGGQEGAERRSWWRRWFGG